MRKMTDDNKVGLIRKAIDLAIQAGETLPDEQRFARIEALLRDALGEKHGVWQWRVGGVG
jgi:hypothetical protein